MDLAASVLNHNAAGDILRTRLNTSLNLEAIWSGVEVIVDPGTDPQFWKLRSLMPEQFLADFRPQGLMLVCNQKHTLPVSHPVIYVFFLCLTVFTCFFIATAVFAISNIAPLFGPEAGGRKFTCQFCRMILSLFMSCSFVVHIQTKRPLLGQRYCFVVKQ